MDWQKVLIDSWEGCDFPGIEDELRRCPVVKHLISQQIGPEVCAELDLDTGAITILDSAFGVELSANSVLLLARFISENAPIVASFVLKVGTHE